MILHLIKLANKLEEIGYGEEAARIDELTEKALSGEWYEEDRKESIERIRKFLNTGGFRYDDRVRVIPVSKFPYNPSTSPYLEKMYHELLKDNAEGKVTKVNELSVEVQFPPKYLFLFGSSRAKKMFRETGRMPTIDFDPRLIKKVDDSKEFENGPEESYTPALKVDEVYYPGGDDFYELEDLK